jgi:two-component sensor histidine kinase
MHHRIIYRYLFLFLYLLPHSSNAAPTVFEDNKMNNEQINAYRLLNLWDQVNENSNSSSDPYTIQVWEHLLATAYQKAIANKDETLQFKLSIPLSFTYHSETKFSLGLPLLLNLYRHKEKLNNIQLKRVLIKLEEEYRASNDITNALKIRKERIENQFINNYWEIYRDCGLYEAAKKDLLQFVPIPPIYSTKRLLHYFLLGDLYFQMNEIDSAKMIYAIGVNQSRETISVNMTTQKYSNDDLLYWEGCFMGNIIKCNIEKGDYKNAIPTLLNDIKYSTTNIDNKILKMILLSKCYQHFHQFNDAKIYLDSATSLFSGKTAKPLLVNLLLTKSSYFSSVNKSDSALFYYKEYDNYRNALNQNIQKNQSVLLLGQLEISTRRKELLQSKQSLYNSLKKNESQNILLLILIFILFTSIMYGILMYRNNLIKSKSKDQIEAQNIMINEHSKKIEAQFNHNELLLKELHHRVKNNLQVMYSLLNLQKRRNVDFETIETLSSIQNRIQTMALVHQNLYTSGNFELVEIAIYINTLANHLASIYKVDKQSIYVNLEIEEDLKLPIEIVVAIGLIVNEAVSNAFKYAFKNKSTGIIQVNIYNIENEISILIQDNGIGFNEVSKKENSLGMKLIELMCSQLRATHFIEKTNGVKHHIKFNLTP